MYVHALFFYSVVHATSIFVPLFVYNKSSPITQNTFWNFSKVEMQFIVFNIMARIQIYSHSRLKSSSFQNNTFPTDSLRIDNLKCHCIAKLDWNINNMASHK